MDRQFRFGAKDKSAAEVFLNGFRKYLVSPAVILPASHGFELTAWVVPPLILTISVLLLGFIVVAWKKRSPRVATAADAPVDPEMESLRSRARRETEL